MMPKRLLYLLIVLMVIPWGAWAGNLKVLVLVGDARTQEPPILTTLNNVGPHTFEYEEILIEGGGFDRDLRGADILWFPWNGPGHDGSYHMAGAEQVVLDFVRDGGAVWLSAFDENYTDGNGNQVGGWFPIAEHPVLVQNTGDSAVELTPEGMASGLFSTPNIVDMDALTLDDNFALLDDAWVVLAKRTDNGQPAACYLEYGSGIYLEACVDTRDQGTAMVAQGLMENALLFLGEHVDGNLTVKPSRKLGVVWGNLKLN